MHDSTWTGITLQTGPKDKKANKQTKVSSSINIEAQLT